MIDIWAAHREFYTNIFRHKELIWTLAYRDLLARYKGSALGFVWTILNPLLLMLTYSVVFKHLSRFTVPDYPLYVLLGVLVWQALSGSISESAYAIQSAGGLVTKTPLPPEIIPVKVVVSQLLNFSLAFLVYIAFAVLMYQRVNFFILFAPVVFLIMFLFSIFSAVIVSLVSVLFRDVQNLIGNILTILFFSTPVVYSYSTLPEKFQTLLLLHPLAQIVRLTSSLIFWGEWPDAGCVLSIGAFLILLEMLAVFTSSLLRRRIAENV
jgi:lipopolysaccharide transport system permease protein